MARSACRPRRACSMPAAAKVSSSASTRRGSPSKASIRNYSSERVTTGVADRAAVRRRRFRSRAVPRRARAPDVRRAAASPRRAPSRTPARRRAAGVGAEPGAPAVARALPAAGAADPHGGAEPSIPAIGPSTSTSRWRDAPASCSSSRRGIFPTVPVLTRSDPPSSAAAAPAPSLAHPPAAGSGMVLPEPADVPETLSLPCSRRSASSPGTWRSTGSATSPSSSSTSCSSASTSSTCRRRTTARSRCSAASKPSSSCSSAGASTARSCAFWYDCEDAPRTAAAVEHAVLLSAGDERLAPRRVGRRRALAGDARSARPATRWRCSWCS